MTLYGPSLLVCLLFLATTPNLGAALNAVTVRRALDWIGLCTCVALGFLAIGLMGLVVWATPLDIRSVATTLLVLANGSALAVNIRRPPRGLSSDGLFGLGLWAALSLLLLVAAQAPIRQPDTLIDGPYVYKRWTLPVRIQVMTGDLPADNAIPAFAAEYMARRIPFSEVRPLMPGQEVANRPLFQALVFLPFRAIFTHDNARPDPYPSFDYVGQNWPDTSPLVSDKTFANYLAVAIPCNAALLLGLGGMLALFGLPYLRTTLVAFGATSPYLITHTVFTWPKNMAALYIVLAALLLERRLASPAWAGLFIGLAFWSHPYATGFEAGFGLAAVAALAAGAFGLPRPAFVGYGRGEIAMGIGAMLLTVAPWYAWTFGILHQSSDMLAQNAGTDQPLAQMVWVRVLNLLYLLNPVDLVPRFMPRALNHSYLNHLVSAVGLVPLLALPVALLRHGRTFPMAIVWLGVIPAAFVVGAFGSPFMLPLYHGWQAVWPALLAAALALLVRETAPRIVLWIALLQLVVNIAMIGLRVQELS